MLKSTTVERYKHWCISAKGNDKFHWQGKGYTKKEFDALHFGGVSTVKEQPKDLEEKDYEHVGKELDSIDTEES